MKLSLVQWSASKTKVVVTNLNVSRGTNRRGLSKIRIISVKEVGPTTAIRRTYSAITVYTNYPCADLFTASVTYFTAKSVVWIMQNNRLRPFYRVCDRGTCNGMQ
jgi:hypothetical protein